MKRILLMLFLVCSPLIAQEAKVDSLVVKRCQIFQGKMFR